MQTITTIGLDIAKSVFQVHGVDADGKKAFRRLQLLRHLHTCSGCFRLERSPGGPCTHWKAPPFHGARQQETPATQKTNTGETQ